MRQSNCRVGIDRFQALAKSMGRSRPPEFPGFRRNRDRLVRSQTSVKTYARVSEYQDPRTALRMYLQYQTHLPTLTPFKVTLIPQDQRLLTFEEIKRVVGRFSSYRPLLVEIALDFSPESGIDLQFVRMHAIFGKSRPKESHLFARSAVYGSRKGDKRIRCYLKEEIGSFRIELELHSSWLRRHEISNVEDFRKLPGLLYPGDIRFVRVDWSALRKYLARRGFDGKAIIQKSKAEFDSIHQVMGFLRGKAVVNNPHRFLAPLPENRQLREALKKWARDF